MLEITYEKMNHEVVTRIVEPAAIMFSEYYFYLTAFIRNIDKKKEFENADDLFPTIYRIDRIKKYKIMDEHFHVQYADRFEEGEFRKRVAVYVRRHVARRSIPVCRTGLSRLSRPPATDEAKETRMERGMVTAEVFGQGRRRCAEGAG